MSGNGTTCVLAPTLGGSFVPLRCNTFIAVAWRIPMCQQLIPYITPKPVRALIYIPNLSKHLREPK